MADHPNTLEVRRWAEAKGLPVRRQGKIPEGLIKAWNRAHPDRPYNKNEAHHGTFGGYGRGCQCDPCLAFGRGYYREVGMHQRAEKKEWDDNGAL